MSSALERIKAQAAKFKETADDMTKVDPNAGSYEMLPEGWSVARLVEYVELGDHAGEYKGKVKAPARVMKLGFALFDEGYTTPDGKPRIIRSKELRVLRDDKAKAFQAFQRLNWKGTATTFPELLGEAFLVEIKHNPGTGKNADKTYVNLMLDTIQPPIDLRSKKPYDVPDAPDEMYKLFLYDDPTMEDWKALEIEGKRDDGSSKNYIQEKIMTSVSFEGSALQRMLGGIAGLPSMSAEDPEGGEEDEGAAAAQDAAPASKPKTPPRRTPPAANIPVPQE